MKANLLAALSVLGWVVAFVTAGALFVWHPLYFVAIAYGAYLAMICFLAFLGAFLSFREKFQERWPSQPTGGDK